MLSFMSFSRKSCAVESGGYNLAPVTVVRNTQVPAAYLPNAILDLPEPF
jgi:hypothetical protein